MIKLSVSNIAWDEAYDDMVYALMQKRGFSGLEIAPTRIFRDNPYDHTGDAKIWAKNLQDKFGLTVSSMQSIWYGRTEKIFSSEHERETLLSYTKKAIDFAEAINCKNLVFGCPKNRVISDISDYDSALEFFHELGEYARKHSTVIAMEANPVIYGTNYINTTHEAVDLVRRVCSDGFKLNLDTGTMIYGQEDISVLYGIENLINHIHISEPGLKPVHARELHRELLSFVIETGYQNFISLEAGKQESLIVLSGMMDYMTETFNCCL